MRSEREKMLAGELYDALDPDLVADRNRARDLCQTLNMTREAEQEVAIGVHEGAPRGVGSGCEGRVPSLADAIRRRKRGPGATLIN